VKKGQSLFEVVVALAIVTLIVVAIITLAASSIKNSSFARNKETAARYSQEATEWLRGQRDNDWAIFASHAVVSPGLTWCLSSLVWPGTTGPCSESSYIGDTFFTREVVVSYPDPLNLNNVQVDVATYWTDSSGDHEVKTSTFFANWKVE